MTVEAATTKTPRVALVTGSAQGMGRAQAIRLAQQGRTVVIADINDDLAAATAKEIGDLGVNAVSVHMDVSNSDSVTEGMKSAVDQVGPIDILVNCAGWDMHLRFVETEQSFWYKVIEINYLSVLRTCQAVLPGMIEREWGRIVNIGSDAGRVGSSQEAVYSGAKGAVIGFSKALAREVARKGITVNVVCPGPTLTPRLQNMLNESEDGPKLIAAMQKVVPMKRLGDPLEVAVGVALFTSDDAVYMTGQTLSVSGGLTMC
jgi:2-hydroxycyclohexanecarboxyl-CoA dehydrogenase